MSDCESTGWECEFLDVEMDVAQPFPDIKAGTGFLHPGEVAMAENLGVRIVETQTPQESLKTVLLRLGARVGRIAVGIKTALIADADAVGIVVLGMGANHGLGTARIDGSVLSDVVVVADGAETTRLVAGFKCFDREVAVGSGGRAVDDDKVYFSHVS